MPRALLVVGLLAAAGCLRPYEAPTPEMPNAIVKFRRTYQDTPGVRLTEAIRIDRHGAFDVTAESARGETTRTDAILVHPGAATFAVSSMFWHTATRRRTQTYQCGTSKAPRTCTRTVTENYTVVDGRCADELRLATETGGAYLIELDYQDANNCSVRCYVQTMAGSGEFTNDRCTLLPIEE